jgi:hypothetical protein
MALGKDRTAVELTVLRATKASSSNSQLLMGLGMDRTKVGLTDPFVRSEE